MQEQQLNKQEFNDKDIMMDLLTSLKALSNLYGTTLQEASNDAFYQDIEELSTEICDAQRQVYYKLYSLGWYTLEKSTEAKIGSTITKYDKSKKELA